MSSRPGSTFWKSADTSSPMEQSTVIVTIHAMPTRSTEPLDGSCPMPSAPNRRNRYGPATWARLAMTSTSAATMAHPPIHPVFGPNARGPQVNVVPQSGSALFSSL